MKKVSKLKLQGFLSYDCCVIGRCTKNLIFMIIIATG
jgi:hypothetical protein